MTTKEVAEKYKGKIVKCIGGTYEDRARIDLPQGSFNIGKDNAHFFGKVIGYTTNGSVIVSPQLPAIGYTLSDVYINHIWLVPIKFGKDSMWKVFPQFIVHNIPGHEKCPLCGSDGFVLFNMIECSNSNCINYKQSS